MDIENVKKYVNHIAICTAADINAMSNCAVDLANF